MHVRCVCAYVRVARKADKENEVEKDESETRTDCVCVCVCIVWEREEGEGELEHATFAKRQMSMLLGAGPYCRKSRTRDNFIIGINIIFL